MAKRSFSILSPDKTKQNRTSDFWKTPPPPPHIFMSENVLFLTFKDPLPSSGRLLWTVPNSVLIKFSKITVLTS